MKFEKEYLQSLAWDEQEAGEVIETTIVDTTRWSIIKEMIFELGGKYYRTSYSEGATEGQDEDPYEYEDDEIECPEVEKVQVMKEEWQQI